MRRVCDKVLTDDGYNVIDLKIPLVFAGLGFFLFGGPVRSLLYLANGLSRVSSFEAAQLTAKSNALCRVGCQCRHFLLYREF